MPKGNTVFSTSRVLVAVVAVLALLLAACGSTPSVVKVTIKGGNIALKLGASQKLTADVSVIGGAAKTVTWKSNDTSVATVTKTGGMVTAMKTGTAKITATSTVDKTKSDTITVTVQDAKPTITSFSASSSTVTEGDTVTLSWDVIGATSLSLSDGSNTITIPQTATGSVDVTPALGTVTYTLSATNSLGTTTATAKVTVQAAASKPTISDFSYTPASPIDPGSSVTLSWTTAGATSWSLSDGSNPITIPQTASGTKDVTPSAASTTYTLTASNSQGDTTATATVTLKAPVVSNLTATVGMGSTLDLSWSATNATSYSVYSVLNTDTTDQQLIDSNLTGTTDTIDIPASTRQIIRVIATGPGGTGSADVTPTNVVVSTQDYDPFALGGRTPDTPIPGTLRYVIDHATAGSIIGFASDITSIDIGGVDTVPTTGGNLDAHLIFRRDETVSGPAGGVTLNGVSAAPPATPNPFTWESRMMLVTTGTTVQLDHLTIQGGTFIYNGGGIENRGDLTLTNTTVTGNRAWQQGGGIYNQSTGTLTLTDSHIDNNTSLTEDAEMGTTYTIHGTPYTTTPSDGGYGGGLFNNGGTVTTSNTTFDGNFSKYSGGGIYNNSGTVTMDGSPVANNTADYTGYTHDSTAYAYGGGIYNGDMLDYSNANITGNTATDVGGGFAIEAVGTSTLTNVLFDGDSANWGGGIEHYYCSTGSNPNNLTLNSVTYGTNVGTSGYPNIQEVDTCTTVTPVRQMSITPDMVAPKSPR